MSPMRSSDGRSISRLAKVHFEDEEKIILDEQFEELTEGEELSNRQQMRAKWARLEAIVGNPNRIEKIACARRGYRN